MNIIAIDPGPELSALVAYDPLTRLPLDMRLIATTDALAWLRRADPDDYGVLAVEYTPPYTLQTASGQGFVPSQVVATAIEIGAMREAWCGAFALVSRLDVKKHLLGKTSGNDAMVAAALVDRYGGTLAAAKGTKRARGPLYGIKRDLWAALAVAVTWCESRPVHLDAHAYHAEDGL